MSATWTTEDSIAAVREGWDIFTCSGGSENGLYQLCKLDAPEDEHWRGTDGTTPPALDDDSDAWEVVWRAADGGSSLHQRALAFLDEHNPQERKAIESHMSVVFGEEQGVTP